VGGRVRRVAYVSHDFDVGGASAIAGCYCVHDEEDVLLHHPHEVEVAFALGHVTEVLDEVHDVGAVVHGALYLYGVSVEKG